MSVRQSPTEKDQHGQFLNLFFFTQTLDANIRTPAGGWQRLLDQLINDDIAEMFWFPPEKLKTEKDIDNNIMAALGVAPDEDIVSGSCLPSCLPKQS